MKKNIISCFMVPWFPRSYLHSAHHTIQQKVMIRIENIVSLFFLQEKAIILKNSMKGLTNKPYKQFYLKHPCLKWNKANNQQCTGSVQYILSSLYNTFFPSFLISVTDSVLFSSFGIELKNDFRKLFLKAFTNPHMNSKPLFQKKPA